MFLEEFFLLYWKGVVFAIIVWLLSRPLTSASRLKLSVRSFSAAIGLGIAIVPGHGSSEGFVPTWFYLYKGLKWLAKSEYSQSLLYFAIGLIFLIPWWIVFFLVIKRFNSKI